MEEISLHLRMSRPFSGGETPKDAVRLIRKSSLSRRSVTLTWRCISQIRNRYGLSVFVFDEKAVFSRIMNRN